MTCRTGNVEKIWDWLTNKNKQPAGTENTRVLCNRASSVIDSTINLKVAHC